MKKTYISWQDLTNLTHELVRQISLNDWRPDYVVGLTRGGLTPATLISQYFDVPMHTLRVSLRDGGDGDCESNLWMAEDANSNKNILIVDDINDTGATLDWIRRDWEGSCLPGETNAWSHVWNHNVRFAVLVDNLSSACSIKMDYAAQEINKAEDPSWIVFPWEDWWKQ